MENWALSGGWGDFLGFFVVAFFGNGTPRLAQNLPFGGVWLFLADFGPFGGGVVLKCARHYFWSIFFILLAIVDDFHGFHFLPKVGGSVFKKWMCNSSVLPLKPDI